MNARDQAWEAYLAEPASSEYPETARGTFNAAWDAATEHAYAQAAKIAQEDSMTTTLRDFSQHLVVEATGKRIGFNIQALASRERRS